MNLKRVNHWEFRKISTTIGLNSNGMEKLITFAFSQSEKLLSGKVKKKKKKYNKDSKKYILFIYSINSHNICYYDTTSVPYNTNFPNHVDEATWELSWKDNWTRRY